MKRMLFTLVLLATPVAAQDVNPRREDIPEAQRIYSPYVNRLATNNMFAEGLFWGDTHLHTSYSTDAGMIGNTLAPGGGVSLCAWRRGLDQHGAAGAVDSPAGLSRGF